MRYRLGPSLSGTALVPATAGSLGAMNEPRPATASRRWLRRPWLLPGGLLLLLTFLTVNVLADGPLVSVDQHIHQAAHRTANSAGWLWLKDRPAAPARILVDLGNIRFAFPILLAVAGYVAFRHRSLRPLLTAVTGIVLVLATVVPAKIAIGRPNPGHGPLRPDKLLGAFPSGHTTTACVCYVLAALLLTPGAGRRTRRIAVSTAAALGALVGAAMIWCGLHWFTDVIAGFALAGLIVPLTMWLTCRGRGARWPGRSPPDESRTLAASAGRQGPSG
jgi:membrane-associated phospholipid phosphatase